MTTTFASSTPVSVSTPRATRTTFSPSAKSASRRPPPTIRSAPTRASSSPTTSTASITNVSPTSGSTPTPRRRASSPSSVKPALRRTSPSPSPTASVAGGTIGPSATTSTSSTCSCPSPAHRRFNPIPSSACPPSSDVDNNHNNVQYPITVCPPPRRLCLFKCTVTESRRVTRARAIVSTDRIARNDAERRVHSSRLAHRARARAVTTRGRDETTDGCDFVPRRHR